MKRIVVAGAAVVAALAVVLLWSRCSGGAATPPEQPSATPTKHGGDHGPKKRGDRNREGGEGGEAAVLVDDDPAGDLRLEGIVTLDDAPVAGVTVTLAANPPRTATSADNGTFLFEGLVSRPYTVVARGKEGVAGPVTVRVTTKTDLVQLHLRPAAHLTVTVTGPGGKPVDGATVELRGIDDQHATAAAGTAKFDSVVLGDYQLAAWADGMARSHQWLSIGAGDNSAHVVLQPGAAVTGKVVDERNQPVAGARVVYSGTSNWSQQGNRRRDAVTSAADGTFKFDALPAGTFRFLGTHGSFAPGTSPPITLDGAHEKTGILLTMSDGATVRGRVVDGTHQGVAGARVRIGVASRNAIFEPPRQAYSDDTGAFEIKGLPKKDLVAVAIHETGASADVKIDGSRGSVNNVELAIDVTGVIAGVVVDSTGQPIEGVQVSAGPNFAKNSGDFQQWRIRGFPEDLSDANGHFQLSGLAPGSYKVSATHARSNGRGRRGMGDGVTAEAGTRDLRIVLQPEGGVKGKVAMTDGTSPSLFTVSVGPSQQSFTSSDGSFELDGLPPQDYEVNVRGPQFMSKSVQVTVEPNKIADAGTISVAPGRTIGGIVVANGTPVPNADVFAGRIIFGNGTSNSAQFGPMGQGTKQTTTGPDGTFSLSGFSDGDISVVAEEDSLGRSAAIRLPTVMPGQTDLTIELQPFGSLSGILRQGGKPAEGVFVTCQSTSTPGALYSVASGPDGSYRFDRLAPDTYKVSATLGMPMMGMRFYSQQITIASGQAATIDLAADGGAIDLMVTVVPKSGVLGVASVWLASGTVVASTANDLSLKLAALGQSASQWVIIRSGEPADMKEVAPGDYSVCVVPFPAEVKGMGTMGYMERHGDKLPAYCRPVSVAAAPAAQGVSVPVELPPFIPDQGSGAGSGAPTK